MKTGRKTPFGGNKRRSLCLLIPVLDIMSSLCQRAIMDLNLVNKEDRRKKNGEKKNGVQNTTLKILQILL